MTVTNCLTAIDFGSLSLEAITAFFVFDVRLERDGSAVGRRFAVRLPIEGAPEDRHDRVMRAVLTDRAKVTRFLLLLLAGESADPAHAVAITLQSLAGHSGNGQQALTVPLFEFMVRAFDRDPARLGDVERAISQLRSAPEHAELLPPDFEVIWEPIWTACQERLSR